MSEKKGIFARLFGRKESSGCCNMEIVEKPTKKGSCCDMEIVPEESGCNCREGTAAAERADRETAQADILILGPGCKNCQGLEKNVKEALKKMGKEAQIAHVTDFQKIAAFGVMSTPGLVVKGKLLTSGKVLKADALVELLEKNL